MLCISTSKRVLCTLFAAQNYLFQSFNENWCNYISKKNSSSCFRVPAMHEPGSKFIKYLANFQVLEAPKSWSKYTAINPSIHPSICLSISPSIYLSICSSVCLSVSIFTFPMAFFAALGIGDSTSTKLKCQIFFSKTHLTDDKYIFQQFFFY